MINSIKNAVNIIECFTAETPEMGVSEISTLLDMNKSTIHHIIKTLHGEGILVKTHNRKYRLGSKLLGWGNLASNQYHKLYNASPYLDELVRKTNETVHLAVQENDRVSYLAKVEPKRPVKIKTAIGSHSPMHCTGLGKMLLTDYLYEDCNKIYDLTLTRFTENTLTDHEELINELKQIKKQGYAIDNEEIEIGLYCIAAPIKDCMGNIIAAISIAGPEFRINNENEDFYLSNLIATAKKISDYCDL